MRMLWFGIMCISMLRCCNMVFVSPADIELHQVTVSTYDINLRLQNLKKCERLVLSTIYEACNNTATHQGLTVHVH